MLAYRAISGAVAIVLGCILLAEMATIAQRDGTKIAMGVVLGVAFIAYGAHRLWLVWQIRRAQ